MDAALQKRTGIGLVVILIGHVVAFLLPQVASVVASSLVRGSLSSAEGPPRLQPLWIANAASTVVILSLWGAGAILLAPRLRGYAHAALAAFAVYLGFDFLRLAISLGANSDHTALSDVALRFAVLGLISSVLHVLVTVAMLLMLRRATELAGARASTAAAGLVIAYSCWSLVRNVAMTLIARTMSMNAMQAFNYFGTFMYALLCGTFVWMAYRARKATLGVLLDPTVTSADAYRGATGLR